MSEIKHKSIVRSIVSAVTEKFSASGVFVRVDAIGRIEIDIVLDDEHDVAGTSDLQRRVARSSLPTKNANTEHFCLDDDVIYLELGKVVDRRGSVLDVWYEDDTHIVCEVKM